MIHNPNNKRNYINRDYEGVPYPDYTEAYHSDEEDSDEEE